MSLDKEMLVSEKGDLDYVVVGRTDNGRYVLEDPDTGEHFEFAIVDGGEDPKKELQALERLGYAWKYKTEEAA